MQFMVVARQQQDDESDRPIVRRTQIQRLLKSTEGNSGAREIGDTGVRHREALTEGGG